MSDLPPPNADTPVTSSDDCPFPLKMLNWTSDNLQGPTRAFVHERYACDERALQDAPTWMDPYLLWDLAQKRSEVLAAYRDTCKFPDNKAHLKRLAELLVKVFEEEYLVFAVKQFPKVAMHFAAWLREFGKERTKRRRIKYRWVCQRCGERRGVHFYPAKKCSGCGGTKLKKERTNDAKGWFDRGEM